MTKVCTACGLHAEGEHVELCSKCGHAMRDKNTPLSILCSGTRTDGSTCEEKLTAENNICPKCGQQVDPQLFTDILVCSQCKARLHHDTKFCQNCGATTSPDEKGKPEKAIVSHSKQEDDNVNHETYETAPNIHGENEDHHTTECETKHYLGVDTNIAEYPNAAESNKLKDVIASEKDKLSPQSKTDLEDTGILKNESTHDILESNNSCDQQPKGIASQHGSEYTSNRNIDVDTNITEPPQEAENHKSKEFIASEREKQSPQSEPDHMDTDSVSNESTHAIPESNNSCDQQSGRNASQHGSEYMSNRNIDVDTTIAEPPQTSENHKSKDDIASEKERKSPQSKHVDTDSLSTESTNDIPENHNSSDQQSKGNASKPVAEYKTKRNLGVDTNIAEPLQETQKHNSQDVIASEKEKQIPRSKPDHVDKDILPNESTHDTPESHRSCDQQPNGNVSQHGSEYKSNLNLDVDTIRAAPPQEAENHIKEEGTRRCGYANDNDTGQPPTEVNTSGFVSSINQRERETNKSQTTKEHIKGASHNSSFFENDNKENTSKEISCSESSKFEQTQASSPDCNEHLDQDNLTEGSSEPSTEVRTDPDANRVVDNEGTSVDPVDDTNGQRKSDSYNDKTDNEKKGSSRADKTARRGSRQNKDERTITVKFHVLVSKDFNFAPEDKVVIKIGHPKYGGWDSKTFYILQSVRETESYRVMEIKLDFDSFSDELSYKYAVIRETGKHKWEKYINTINRDEHSNRSIHFGILKEATDCFNVFHHQYDGFVVPQDSNLTKLINMFPGPWTSNKCLAHIYMKECCKEQTLYPWKEFIKLPVQQTIDHFDRIIYCLTKVYMNDWGCWSTRYDMEQEIMGPVLTYMLKLNDSTHMEKRIHSACLVVLLSQKFNVALYGEVSSLLCMSFKVSASTEEDGCRELNFMTEKVNSKQLSSIGNGLWRAMVNSANHKKDPSWMYCVPIYHFLMGRCVPYQSLTDDIVHDGYTWSGWWGTNDIMDVVKDFQGHQTKTWTIDLRTVLNELSPLFSMDYLLPRTIMASLTIFEIEEATLSYKIPLDVCFANLIFFMTVLPAKEYGIINRCVSQVVNTFNDYRSQSNRQSKTQDWMTYTIARQMLFRCKLFDMHLMLVQLYLWTISDYIIKWDGDANVHESTFDVYDDFKNFVDDALYFIGHNMHFHSMEMEDVVQVLDRLSTIKLSSELLTDKWMCSVKDKFAKMISDQVLPIPGKSEQLIGIYCKNRSSYTQQTQECIDGFILKMDGPPFTELPNQGSAKNLGRTTELVDSNERCKAIEEDCNLDVHSQTGNILKEEKNHFWKLFSKLLIKEWNTMKSMDGQEDITVRLALEWKPFLFCLRLSNTAEIKENDECLDIVNQIVSVLQQQFDSIDNGTVVVKNLKKLYHVKESLEELLHGAFGLDKRKTLHHIELCWNRLQFVERAIQQLTIFRTACISLLEVDFREIDAILGRQDQLNLLPLDKLYRHGDISMDDELYQGNIEILKHIPPCVREIMSDMVNREKSRIFMRRWHMTCKKKHEVCRTMADIEEHIWKEVQTWWEKTYDTIKDGSIYFQEIRDILDEITDKKAILSEFALMDIPDDIIKERINQLEQYAVIQTSVTATDAVLRFAKTYHLGGDFSALESIETHQDRDFHMREFGASLIDIGLLITDLTTERIKCLDAFTQSYCLVTWLRESMKTSGLRELKVFVELASMSAGDDHLKRERVLCFDSCVTGFAPLIFDLKPDMGYQQTLKLCEQVWTELEQNPKLPEQMINTNKILEWFKDVEKSHGSVEKTSLTQCEIINSGGVYVIGGNFHCNAEEMDINNVISLCVAESSETSSETTEYSFKQLQDLQSRLMLVAGKDERTNNGINRFTLIFDSIIRLAKVYIKLCSAGCVLFKRWTAEFLCNPGKNVCAILEFGEDIFKGYRKEKRGRNLIDDDELTKVIQALADFMETSLTNWLFYIKQNRRKFKHLNFFTIDQLVLLQEEMMHTNGDIKPSQLLYPLLTAVKKDCTSDDLLNAINTTRKAIETIERTREKTDVTESQEPSTEKDNEFEHISWTTFIKEMEESGFGRNLALKALVYVESEDIEGGIDWCNEHDDEEEEEEEEEERGGTADCGSGYDVEHAHLRNLSGWNQSGVSLQQQISGIVKGLQSTDESYELKSLVLKLDKVWNGFIESITSNVCDYLSLEHLGMVLDYLAIEDTYTKSIDKKTLDKYNLIPLEPARQLLREGCKYDSTINRVFPVGYQVGEPNLIVCSSTDVLTTTLTLYSNDRTNPLPFPDEVLICTPDTTLDQVDIFWLRAIFGSNGKIHCLVNADLLNFDVSDVAERTLHAYMDENDICDTKQSYRLFIICGSHNEYRSQIIASLDKFRQFAPPVNMAHIQHYMKKQLIVKHTMCGMQPASFVDFDNSSVRVVKSFRSGVGKTLYKTRRGEDLLNLAACQAIDESEEKDGNNKKTGNSVSVPIHEKYVDTQWIIRKLLKHTHEPGELVCRMFHLDIANEVQHGVDNLLFNLLVLGCLTDNRGYVWRKSPSDLYLIETVPHVDHSTPDKRDGQHYIHQMLHILPSVTCRGPLESLAVYTGHPPIGYDASDQLFDRQAFRSSLFQRPFQYLLKLDEGDKDGVIEPEVVKGNPQLCLETILRHCGVHDPSWSELSNFVLFLNAQLKDFEDNNFLGHAAAQDLPGFSEFVLKSLLQMSKDFSTRSLNMSEETPRLPAIQDDNGDGEVDDGDERGDDVMAFRQFEMRRTWERSPHPYLFFNPDKTFTFLGFQINPETGDLIDGQTGNVLEEGVMQKRLYFALLNNNVPMTERFDDLNRNEMLDKLCSVIGIDNVHDPDDTYELTTDNVKKILAIYMRFRCSIPVIIMGETGCGKTRLVKFMCALQVPPLEKDEIQNLVLMKETKRKRQITNKISVVIHGGTTNADIIEKVKMASKLASNNAKKHGDLIFTVLFLDEANTTESIGLIKEILCDRTLQGDKDCLSGNLKIIAACNPYRKHSDELIKQLEQAGLGYHVDADQTEDRFHRVPMRRLVYRVQPLPSSLLPLVWDFGQLDTDVEKCYIKQMVRRHIEEDRLPNVPKLNDVLSSILTASQAFMRKQKDECKFVSLRDVERTLDIMSWFYKQSQGKRTLFNLMDERLHTSDENKSDDDTSTSSNDDNDDEDDDFDVKYEAMEDKTCLFPEQAVHLDKITRSLVLALGVCYHACLTKREEYRKHIAKHFTAPCCLPQGQKQMETEIYCCQDVFLDNIELGENIAKNIALKENVFMMIVCIQLRIPLFLVGKPGSSKSLAKTIVSDAMEGKNSKSGFFKELKQTRMVSFQCSPLSTADAIVGTFVQCAEFQIDKDLDSFVSVVVLDEVGLAEDSPRMPLKTLHPLLEDGCHGGDHSPEKYKKVGFIGISNWALDPAKMNRGILVQRQVPDLKELTESARDICSIKDDVYQRIADLVEPMAQSYLEIFKTASKKKREFFGLRDFYSLVKMVYAFAVQSQGRPTWHQMVHAIERNFDGLENIDPLKYFTNHLSKVMAIDDKPGETDPDCSSAGLIKACLKDGTEINSDSRYLLLLTENYGALNILQQQMFSTERSIKPMTLFGSSFRNDQEYTQVCRNINKIKVCMETGSSVVLLNLENLYESLYDALNQYYVYWSDKRFVDLGLGTHRVKCRVHQHFRLIVVAEKETVYKKFPIPLINRLEKHFLTINTLLSQQQQRLAARLKEWAIQFVQTAEKQMASKRESDTNLEISDAFIGYHDDTCASIILYVCSTDKYLEEQQILLEAKRVLLWCATPESVLRLGDRMLGRDEQQKVGDEYFKEQRHDSLAEYLDFMIVTQKINQLFAQVTTHSKLLTPYQLTDIANPSIPVENIKLLENLTSFNTEQQFSNKIKRYLKNRNTNALGMLIVQCDSGDVNQSLIACAKYSIMDEIQRDSVTRKSPVHVVLVIHLPKMSGNSFKGFQCGPWHSVHIDNIWTAGSSLVSYQEMRTKSVATLVLEAAMNTFGPHQEHQLQERDSQKGTRTVPLMETGERYHREKSLTHATLEMIKPVDPARSEGDQPLSAHVSGGVRHQQTINMQSLLLACTHSALSMIRDDVRNIERSTERLRLVLSYFKSMSVFVKGVSFILANLLKEKEERHTWRANRWLATQATVLENINKAGTFRQSCLQTIEEKLIPMLTLILAYLDINQNLSLLHRQSSWKTDIWFALFKYQCIMNLKYTDEDSQMTVKYTGRDGHVFQCCFPFSWLVFQHIDDLLNSQALLASDVDELSQEQCVELTVNLLRETSIGKVLTAIGKNHVDEILTDYRSDCLHFLYIYNAISPAEFKLVFDIIATAASEIGTYEHELLHGLICVHLAFKALDQKLEIFQSINHVWPECSDSLLKFKTENPDHFLSRADMNLSGLCFLLEHLAPEGDSLKDPTKRTYWLGRVHHYRPVVEKTLGVNVSIDKGPSFQTVKRARCFWSRVVVMKLFIEHVCCTATTNIITGKHCMRLWKFLGDEANLQEVRSIQNIEKFLKGCNATAVNEINGEKQQKCCMCETKIDSIPFTLPCQHVFCDMCFAQTKKDSKCRECKEQIPDTWMHSNPKDEREQEKRTKLKDYQKRCNNFFMDVVSQLCFHGNNPPSDEVIDKLLNYITYTTTGPKSETDTHDLATKEMSIFNTGLDPNPVFRSFLLQLLIRTSEEQVKQNLTKYLEQAKHLMGQQAQHQQELMLLIIQCLEDIFHQEVIKMDKDEANRYATRCLDGAKATMLNVAVDVEQLYGLAKARFGLTVVARRVSKIVVDELNETHLEEKITVMKLIESAQQLCEQVNCTWQRTFLVKQIYRCYGMEIYQALCKTQLHYLRWITLQDDNKFERIEGSDRYVICGKVYRKLRETIPEVIIEGNVEILETVLQELDGEKYLDVYLLLAVFREITYSNLYPVDRRHMREEMIVILKECIMACKANRDKTLLEAFFHNRVGGDTCRQLTVTEGMGAREQGIQCVLVHFMCVFHGVDDTHSLLQPLKTLIRDPTSLRESYLPTMPQDDFDEVNEVILANRTGTLWEDNPVFHNCPNGHPYLIGDCGRPWGIGNCDECGAEIGGNRHVLLPDNEIHDGGDRTKKGHILGPSENRDQRPLPQRQMHTVECACLRLLTHCAMYLGARDSVEDIQALIYSDAVIEDAPEFLWKHILTDIRDLETCLGRSVDDVLILVHTTLERIMTHSQSGTSWGNSVFLQTKKDRADWELRFCTTFLQPLLQTLDDTITAGNMCLTEDNRTGVDPVLCLVYELAPETDHHKEAGLHELDRVWRYRTPITLSHLKQQFEVQFSLQGQHRVLDLFLTEEPYLRGIKYLPSIFKLQKALYKKYHRKLDKVRSSEIKIRQVLREAANQDTVNHIQDFKQAWEIVRHALKQYLCPTENGRMQVPAEFCNDPITNESPMAVLIPSSRDAGLCCYAMLHFLMKKQTDFLEGYAKITNRELVTIPQVQPNSITQAHLICFDEQKDILPLVLANCQYSFEIGKGTKIEYDFSGLERQLIDRFVVSKSRIQVGNGLKIAAMIDFNKSANTEVFKTLNERIKQVALNSAAKLQITRELVSLPAICKSLQNLDITIGFLKAASASEDQSLQQFMEKTLHMSTTIQSEKARQLCQLQHVKDLWLLLSLEKSKKMADHFQPTHSIFENVMREFFAEIPTEAMYALEDFTREISLVQLCRFVELFHEFIVLFLSSQERSDDESFRRLQENSLKDWILQYAEDSDLDESQVLKTIPDGIANKHCVNAWLSSYKTLQERMSKKVHV